MRLVKFLARAGIASRRHAETIIRAGRVTVNGMITNLPQTLVYNQDRVTVDGIPVKGPENKIYILLNKPPGYISTVVDTHGRPTVLDLIDDLEERLYPVGRLDADTRGVIILTNDGELAYRLTHPSYQIKKTYNALLSGLPDLQSLNKIEKGLMLDGEITAPATVNIIKKMPESNSSLVSITLTEGRKRQVKNMFSAIGFPVEELARVSFAGLTVNDLKEGSYRYLLKNEVEMLFRKAGL